jgi:ABC-type transporter Mla MlaB component
MENLLQTTATAVNPSLLYTAPQTPAEAPATNNFNSFLFGGVINDEPRGSSFDGVTGILTYDLSNVFSINNTGLAHMIDLMKSSLKNGIEVQFINVTEKVKAKIKTMGMFQLINCN